MANIFDISDWDSATTYRMHDIVKYGNYYYYSLTDNNLSQDPTVLNTVYWGGTNTDDHGVIKPIFLWKPVYGSNINHEPLVKLVKFGDGYEQRIADGINNSLLKFDMNFEGKTEREARAILHFLHARNGTESFLWTPTAPYDKQMIFVCRNFTTNPVFFGNFAIRASFDQVAA